MFLLDDILLSPFKGLAWIFRELHRATNQENANERDRLSDELGKAYMMLETGQIAESEFASLEKRILDRLDELNAAGETDVSAGATEASEPKDHGGR
jgi:hypothetical protein